MYLLYKILLPRKILQNSYFVIYSLLKVYTLFAFKTVFWETYTTGYINML